jgi:hypothetical protein
VEITALCQLCEYPHDSDEPMLTRSSLSPLLLSFFLCVQIKPDLRDQFYKREARLAFDPSKSEKKGHH